MPRDEDRGVAALQDLTNQMSRLAWAVEVLVTSHLPVEAKDVVEARACHRCGSQLVLRSKDVCSACGEPKREKSDG